MLDVDIDHIELEQEHYSADSNYTFGGAEISYSFIVNRLFYLKFAGNFYPNSEEKIYKLGFRDTKIEAGRINLLGYSISIGAGFHLAIKSFLLEVGGGYIFQTYKLNFTFNAGFGDNYEKKVSKNKPYLSINFGIQNLPAIIYFGADFPYDFNNFTASIARIGVQVIFPN